MMLTPNDILPIIILYRTHLSESKSYLSFVKNAPFQQFFVYDNSPKDFNSNSCDFDKRAVYHRNINNGGISKAANHAAKFACEQGYKRLLLLDQDSTFPPQAIHHYLSADASIPISAPSLRTKDSLFSPSTTNTWFIRGVKLVPGVYPLSKFAPVNSGMCIDLSAFQRAGGYKEDIFLDYADYTFCQRIQQIDDRFELLPFTVEQDFSNDVTNKEALLHRFNLFLLSVRQCHSFSKKSTIQRHFQVFTHTLSITLKTKSTVPLQQFLSIYLFKISI